jgi:hypothetical protein
VDNTIILWDVVSRDSRGKQGPSKEHAAAEASLEGQSDDVDLGVEFKF